MTSALPPLAWLRTFETSARLRGFAAAARELNLTPAAVSQQVRALEAHFGFALFERLPRGVRLTTMGAAYLPMVRKALDDLSAATAGLFGAPGRRRLTIRCSASFGALCLSPRLGAFHAAHPDIELRVLASIWSESLDDQRVDVDIRYGDGRWEGHEIEPLGDPVSIPVCPPGAEFGARPAARLEALARRGLVHIIGCEDLWPRMARSLGLRLDDSAPGVHVDTSVIALETAAAGLGCAMISRDLARLHLDSGRVSAPPGLELRHEQAHYLLMSRQKHGRSADALLFRAWLLENFRCGGAAG